MGITRIISKHSEVPGKVPALSDLEVGELALNVPDKKIYFTDGAEIFSLSSDMGDLEYQLNINIPVISSASTIFYNKFVNELMLSDGDVKNIVSVGKAPTDNVLFDLMVNGVTIGKISIDAGNTDGDIELLGGDINIVPGNTMRIDSPLDVKGAENLSITLNFLQVV